MQSQPYNITLLLLLCILLIVLMGSFILTILFLYRKKQIAYLEKLSSIQADYEKNLLQTQLEIQEQTFEHISKEIHDNINLSLTLAKLNLNTINYLDERAMNQKVEGSIELLTKSIAELSNLSKGLNADNIFEHGLAQTLEREISRIREVGEFKLNYEISGSPLFLNAQRELIVFRIVQEGFYNILKHSGATYCELLLHYGERELHGVISDNGKGFVSGIVYRSEQAGLKNMQTRARILGGELAIKSAPEKGTKITFKIPYQND